MTYAYDLKAFHMQKRDHQNPTLFVKPKHVGWDPEEQHTPLVKASLYSYLTRMYSCTTTTSTETTQPQSRTINSKTFYKQEEQNLQVMEARTVVTYLVLNKPLIPNND
jgi:hypothetical protein